MYTKDNRQKYESPQAQEFIFMTEGIIAASGGASLMGSGADESDADENGGLIW